MKKGLIMIFTITLGILFLYIVGFKLGGYSLFDKGEIAKMLNSSRNKKGM